MFPGSGYELSRVRYYMMGYSQSVSQSVKF